VPISHLLQVPPENWLREVWRKIQGACSLLDDLSSEKGEENQHDKEARARCQVDLGVVLENVIRQ